MGMPEVIQVVDLRKMYTVSKSVDNGKSELAAVKDVSFSMEK